MTDTGIIGPILIMANIAFSYKGFTNQTFFDGYKFEVDRILVNKDYKRLITSGFLHVSWTHLIFNMLSLYAFSGLIESSLGGTKFLIIYFVSLVGGNLLSLFIPPPGASMQRPSPGAGMQRWKLCMAYLCRVLSSPFASHYT